MKIRTKVDLGMKSSNLEEFTYYESAQASNDGMRHTPARVRYGMYRLCVKRSWTETADATWYCYEVVVMADDSPCTEDKALALLAKHGYQPFVYQGHQFPEEYTLLDDGYFLTGSDEYHQKRRQIVRKEAYDSGAPWAEAFRDGEICLEELIQEAREQRGGLQSDTFGYLEGGISLATMVLQACPDLLALAEDYRWTFSRADQQELFGEVDLADLKLNEATSVEEALEIFGLKKCLSAEEERYLMQLPVEERREFVKLAGEKQRYSMIKLWSECELDFWEALLRTAPELDVKDVFEHLLPNPVLGEVAAQKIATSEEVLAIYEDAFGPIAPWREECAVELIQTRLPILVKNGLPDEHKQRILRLCTGRLVKEIEYHDGLEHFAGPVSWMFKIQQDFGYDASEQLAIVQQHVADCMAIDVNSSMFWPQQLMKQLKAKNVPDDFCLNILLAKVVGVKSHDELLVELAPEQFKMRLREASKKKAKATWNCHFGDSVEIMSLVGVKLSRSEVKTLLANDQRIARAKIICNETGEKDGRKIPITNLKNFLFGVPGRFGAIAVRKWGRNTDIHIEGEIPVQAVVAIRDILSEKYEVKLVGRYEQILGK